MSRKSTPSVIFQIIKELVSQAREGRRKSYFCFGLWATLTNLPQLPLDVLFLKVRAERVDDRGELEAERLRNNRDVLVTVVVPPDDFLFCFILKHRRVMMSLIKSSYDWRSRTFDILLRVYMC